MKIIRFNKETLPSRMGVLVPTIRVSIKGHVILNKSAVDKLSLKANDKIELIQNAEAQKEWFLTITNSENGLPLKSNPSQDGLKLQNSVLCQKFISAIAPEEASIMMLLGKEPLNHEGEMFWPIITSSYKQYLKAK